MPAPKFAQAPALFFDATSRKLSALLNFSALEIFNGKIF